MPEGFPALVPYGWSSRWDGLAAEHPGTAPARVVRHDGAGLLLATPTGVTRTRFGRRLDPEPVVGDWIVTHADEPVAVLARASLLRRRTAHGDLEQPLAANVDAVLLVCGLDRPVKAGRIERGVALATDAGAPAAVVCTKAALVDATVIAEARHVVAAAAPGVECVVTSVREGRGLGVLDRLTKDRTVTVLGESGAGKSTIVNVLLGVDAAAIGDVRGGDSKGRHTTTSRELHPLPNGGVLLDTPGIRAVGLWVDPETIAENFRDLEGIGTRCRFSDCAHAEEPGCAITAEIDAGRLDPARVARWRELEAEAIAAERRASAVERRRYEKRFARVTKDAQRRKGN